jgi:hypothetical protein
LYLLLSLICGIALTLIGVGVPVNTTVVGLGGPFLVAGFAIDSLAVAAVTDIVMGTGAIMIVVH